MPGRLRQEIKQTRPFRSIEEEVVLSMLRTADQLALPMNDVLKQSGLSLSQYNVLRILRGSEGMALACGDIAERMVRRDPDLTRLLDRLEARGLVSRSRSTADRRVVASTITADGLALLDSLDQAVQTTVKAALSHMSGERLQVLRDLLEEARGSQLA